MVGPYEFMLGDFVKCELCGWLHFLVEDGNGFDNCFFCGRDARDMIHGSATDAPMGCTIQGINISRVQKPCKDSSQ